MSSSPVERNRVPEDTRLDATPMFSGLAREGKNGPWRYVVSVLLLIFLWVGGGGLSFAVPAYLANNDGNPETYVDDRTLAVVGYPIMDFAAWTLGSYVSLWVGLFIALRFLHCRPFLTLITVYRRVDWRRMAQGFGIYLLLVAAAFPVGYALSPEDFRLVFEPARWLAFVPVVLALIPIQAAGEELLFRGYLLQLFGLATSNAILLSLMTGAIFVLPHLGNPGWPSVGEGFWLVCIDFLIFGFLMALVTLKDGGLELAVGAHIATNILAFLTVNFEESPLDTPSVLEVIDNSYGYLDLTGILIISVVFYLLAFKVFRRKEKPRSSRDHRDDSYTEAT